MEITQRAIGVVHTAESRVPRHWSVSELEGTLVLDEKYTQGLQDIYPGQQIVVLFHFDRSPSFTQERLLQTPPHRTEPMGVFSICSPVRPNRIGLSVVTVLKRKGNALRVKGIDMLDGTPILDIKPHITGEHNCPSRQLFDHETPRGEA